MSDILNDVLKIDKEFFRLKTRVYGPRLNHITWRDEKRMGIKIVKRREYTPEKWTDKALADKIVEIAEAEQR